MSKYKFKVGDIVRLRKGLKADKMYGDTTFKPYMEFSGTGTISGVFFNNSYFVNTGLPLDLIYDSKMLEPSKQVRKEKIVIYREDQKVIAKNTATGKTGVAKCNPADEFDFNTGAKLAFERLTAPEPEKPKYYTGRVVCIKSKTPRFTAGKIYKVDNGALIDNDGSPSLLRYKSLYDINEVFLSTFIELIEN